MSIYRSPQAYQQVMAYYDLLLTQWTIPYETCLIPTQQGDTHVIVAGAVDAPPLVLLHGAGSNSATWLPNIARLSSAYRTYCIDIIGEGGKSAQTRIQRRNGEEPTQWLVQVFDGLGLQAPYVIGLSLGSWFTFQLAAYAPNRIRAGIGVITCVF